jgi:hypothetical protein
VKFNYIVDTIPDITAGTLGTNIPIINSESFLQYRTAGLVAEFIGENVERAADLNSMAQLALDRFLGINVKGRQAVFTRKRPFMAASRTRTIY